MRQKYFHFFSIIFLVFTQLAFITALLLEHKNVFTVLSLTTLFTILIVYNYIKFFKVKEIDFEPFYVMVFVIIGALLTSYLHLFTNLSSVLVATLIGTLASFLPNLNKKSKVLQNIPNAMYCGCFVGMSQKHIAIDYSFIIIAGSIAGIFYMFSKNLFLGVGGKLGTVAFGSVVISSLLLLILS
ncbi:hypothetical protein C7448_1117 [Tenacibaculum gallaicum]|uniref:Uncharacterized protein n=2 Tax=Tenacibaculum gallaicum TaxID=561505 RepID=A0A3E0HF92_9FLAO|nr:hypothetical protein C7448_1117 [Tenacibaculum gallaicum]